MARLQILQLPEGAGDRRPPFILVIDEAATGPDGGLLIKAADFIETREATNARDVFIFEETVTIPANEPVPLTVLSTDGDAEAVDPGLADLVLRALGIELTPGGIPYDEALDNACRQLEKSEAARRHLNRERDALNARLQQVQQTPLGPDAMDAGLEHPNVWLHGYRAGVLAARAASRSHSEKASTL